MQSLSSRIYSLLAVLFFVISSVLRIVAPLIGVSNGINIAFYVCLAVGGLLIILGAVGEDNANKAFEIENKVDLKVFGYLSAIGFFIDFVHQATRIYSYFQEDGYKSLSIIVPICVACVMALASSFYFFTIGMSYGDFGYDFRKLRVLHIAPMLWAIANALGIMTEAISPLKEVNSTIKYATLVVAVLYYYFFAREIDNESSAKKAFVMFSRMLPYLAVVLFIDRVMLLLTKNADMFDKNSVAGLSILLISLFALFHQRSIKKGA